MKGGELTMKAALLSLVLLALSVPAMAQIAPNKSMVSSRFSHPEPQWESPGSAGEAAKVYRRRRSIDETPNKRCALDPGLRLEVRVRRGFPEPGTQRGSLRTSEVFSCDEAINTWLAAHAEGQRQRQRRRHSV